MRGTVFKVSCQQRGNIQNTVVKGLRGVGDAGNKISPYLKVRAFCSLLLTGYFLGEINKQSLDIHY